MTIKDIAYRMLIGLNTLLLATTGLGFIIGWETTKSYLLGAVLLALGLLTFGLILVRKIYVGANT